MQTRLRLMFWLCLLLPLRAWAAEPQAVLPEGCESAVLAWLLPLEMDKPATPEWVLRDVGLDRSRLQLTLEGPGGRKAHAAMAHRLDEGAGDLVGDVRLLCQPDLPQDVCRALHTALTHTPRAQLPWRVAPPKSAGAAQIERPEPQFSANQPTRAARATLLGVWIALLLLLVALARRRLVRLPKWALLGVPAVTLLGVLVRLWLAPRGLQHELFHAAESLSFLHGTARVANGEAVPALVTALNALHDAEDATLYATTLAFSVLTPPALVWFAWQLHRIPRAALLAGTLVALLPTHIHFARSEEFGVVGIALALTSWAAWLDWLKSRETLPLLIAATAGVLAVQSRPEFVLLPLLHLTLLAVVPTPDLLRRRVLLLVLPLAAVAAWPLLVDLRVRGGFPGFSPLAVHAIADRLSWLDASMTVPPMFAWLVLGLAFGLRRAPRPTAWLALWLLLLALLLLSLYVGAGAYAWRIQLLSSVLACIVTALAVEALPPLRSAPAAALVLTATVQLVVVHTTVAEPSLTERQFRFERAAAPRLPHGAEVLAVLNAGFDHPPPLGDLRLGEARVLRDVADPANLEAATDRVFLQSAACWVQWPGEVRTPTGLHPVCQAVHDRFRLEPIAATDLPPTREPPLAWAPIARKEGYRIGFYRLQPR